MAKFRPSKADPYPRVTYIGNPAASRPRDWQALFRNVVADLPGVLAVGSPRPDHLRRRYRGNEICESMPDALQFVIDGAARYYPDVDLRPLRKLLTGLPITPEVLAEAQVAASELAGVVLRDRPGKAAQPAAATSAGGGTEALPVYLASWREILIALELKDNHEDRAKVARLNKAYSGPITAAGQGTQPRVVKATLLEWYRGLEAQFADQQQRKRDAAATVAAGYQYGRAAEVIPDLGGGVKKRRRDRKS